jgi:CRISPR/Cas system CMR-associated protein Cmr5 small subunit
MSLHYFELPKLPKAVDANNGLKLWLALFRAKTEDEINQIESLGGAIMEQAISAYRQITATDEFKELERMRSRARHNEAAALRHARTEGAEAEREKWQSVVMEKDAAFTAALSEKDALIAELQAKLEGRS